MVVLANLKPRNMRGIKSSGMLMAASDSSHENVELLVPPEGSLPGERIWFGSESDKETLPPVATPNQVLSSPLLVAIIIHTYTYHQILFSNADVCLLYNNQFSLLEFFFNRTDSVISLYFLHLLF